jgi:hypothetical protein
VSLVLQSAGALSESTVPTQNAESHMTRLTSQTSDRSPLHYLQIIFSMPLAWSFSCIYSQVIPLPAADPILLIVPAGEEDVSCSVSVHDVFPTPSIDGIGSRATLQEVIALISPQMITSPQSVKIVLSSEAPDAVAVGSAMYCVVRHL